LIEFLTVEDSLQLAAGFFNQHNKIAADVERLNIMKGKAPPAQCWAPIKT
jgi:hypothetical protein